MVVQFTLFVEYSSVLPAGHEPVGTEKSPPVRVPPNSLQVLSELIITTGATVVSSGQVGHAPGADVTELTILVTVLSPTHVHLEYAVIGSA